MDGYERNVDAGTATIYVTGIGALAGQSAAYTFVIDPATLPQPEALKDQAYTGNAVEPGVTIAGLVEGRDYTVRYEDNVEPGTATAVVTGIGNYAGSYTLHFTILEEEPERYARSRSRKMARRARLPSSRMKTGGPRSTAGRRCGCARTARRKPCACCSSTPARC